MCHAVGGVIRFRLMRGSHVVCPDIPVCIGRRGGILPGQGFDRIEEFSDTDLPSSGDDDLQIAGRSILLFGVVVERNILFQVDFARP